MRCAGTLNRQAETLLARPSTSWSNHGLVALVIEKPVKDHTTHRNLAELMKIRPGEQTDRQQILAVHTSAIRELCAQHYTAAEIAAWSDRLREDSYERVIRERTFLVAVDPDVVVGFGQLDITTGKVEAIYVRPSTVRLGVGSRLLRELESVARDRGLGELFLDASLNAVPFYTRAGFRSTEARTHRLDSAVEIACVRMTKSLDLLP